MVGLLNGCGHSLDYLSGPGRSLGVSGWKQITTPFDRGLFLRRSKQTLSTTDTVEADGGVGPILLSPETHQTLKPFSEVPGPRGLPFVGTLWQYLKKDGFGFKKLFEVMQQRSEEYGPIYRERIGLITSVVISDPEEYAKVMHVDGKFPNRLEIEPLAYYCTKRGTGLRLVNEQGDEWYRHRVILSKKTLRPLEVMEYVPGMDAATEDLVKHIRRVQLPDGKVQDVEHEIFKWALESICTVLFEDRIGCFNDPPPQLAQDFIENLVGFFKYLHPLMFNFPIYRVFPTKTWRIFEGYADRVIETGQKFVDKKVAALARQSREGVAEGEKEEKSAFLTYLLSQTVLSPQEANADCVDLMMGSVQTVSNSLLWALYLLAKNPQAQEALYRESMTIIPDKGKITSGNIKAMDYVKACLKESFRMYPITFTTSRRIAKDIEVCGYHIPAGSHCQANLYGMGYNPKLFSNPLRFQPERWLRDNNYDGPVKALTNLSFGHGPRMCIGRRLAEQEIYIALTKIVQNFRVQYVSTEDVQPVLNISMTPDRPVKLAFLPRP